LPVHRNSTLYFRPSAMIVILGSRQSPVQQAASSATARGAVFSP
jgi:hypothetical protein